MNQGGRRPIIGLTTRCRQDEGRCTLAAEYLHAVVRAGGIPIMLSPLSPLSHEFDGAFDILDGLVLTGGGDIDPSYYGKLPHPQNYDVDPQRDAFELALVRWASDTRLPLFGICRGMQVINVALGGTLVAHLPDKVGDNIAHRANSCEPSIHSIRVENASNLAAIVRDTTSNGEFAVASRHHQAVDCMAANLKLAAYAPDGTIEAIEMPDHPFFLGVQWHPELTAACSPLQQQLFDSFVDAARHSKSKSSISQLLRVAG